MKINSRFSKTILKSASIAFFCATCLVACGHEARLEQNPSSPPPADSSGNSSSKPPPPANADASNAGSNSPPAATPSPSPQTIPLGSLPSSPSVPPPGDPSATPPARSTDTDLKVLPPDNSLSSSQGAFRARLIFESGPFVTQESVVRVEFSDPLFHAPLSIQEMTVKPWMSVHGHGAPTRNIRLETVNAYSVRVFGLVFIMSGPWELQITARINGQSDLVVLPLSVP